MSRIYEALRRATDQPADDEPAESLTLEEYPRERSGASDAGDRSRAERDLAEYAPASPGTTGMRIVSGTSSPDSTKTPPTTPMVSTQRPSAFSAPKRDLPPRTAIAPDLVLTADPGLLQQYRRVAGLMHSRQVGQGLKTLTVTSAIETEDKTRTAINLALTLTRDYATRVLLIDANVRQPFVHELVGASNEVAAREPLSRDNRENSLISVSPLFDLLPVGWQTSEPPADLMSVSVPRLIDEYVAAYDWVLVDAPAMSLLDRPHVLARLTQGIVFVIGASTPFPLVERSMAELDRERLVGTVLIGL
jgi:Mrp family chromosome partitioning ATPase